MKSDDMYATVDESELINEPSGSKWFDIILYLVVGFGSQGLIISLLSSFMTFNFDGELGTNEILVAILIPFISFLGTIYFLGILRGKVSIAKLGLFWADWNWRYVIYAILLIFAFMPLRLAAAFGIEYLINGNFDFVSLDTRNEFFNIFPNIPFGFPIMLIGVGILAPLAEELFFRGLVYNWFRDSGSVGLSVVLSSLMFGIAHFDSPGVVASAFVMGAVLAYSYEKTKSLWLPILIHAITNSGSVLLMYTAVWIEKSGLIPPL
jgi:uncharacterized protein